MTQPVLLVDNLSVALPSGADRPMALQDISLKLSAGANFVRGRRIRLG